MSRAQHEQHIEADQWVGECEMCRVNHEMLHKRVVCAWCVFCQEAGR